MTHALPLQLLPSAHAVCRLPPGALVPEWAVGEVVALTRSADELSIVCFAEAVPADVRHDPGWRVLRVAGALDFALVGVLTALLVPLAEAGLSTFVFSTFDTDYVMVREADLAVALGALRAAGHTVEGA